MWFTYSESETFGHDRFILKGQKLVSEQSNGGLFGILYTLQLPFSQICVSSKIGVKKSKERRAMGMVTYSEYFTQSAN